MQQRTLPRLGRSVGVVGLGTWQLGADWGRVDEADALAAATAGLPPLSTEELAVVRNTYDELVRPQVHDRW
ncbi:hypothetical protein [Micromonospora sp. CA-111912]|uniref:hypothetical protein n=1 Tax=Micromonospora sp. CA-111912 TaxID=3239955 RepID=UPI003D8CDCAF